MQKFIGVLVLCCSLFAYAEEPTVTDYLLGAGDVVKISVFSNPDLATETRVSEKGYITFPLVGEIKVAGSSTSEVEREISKQLKGYIVDPQVNVVVSDFQSKTFSVLGNVLKPGKYPIDRQLRLTDALALAGGATPLGSDEVVVISYKDGKMIRNTYDLRQMFIRGLDTVNPLLSINDTIYVPNYPVFYIYGEVQHPGFFRIDMNMRVSQALATGGGLTARGSRKAVSLERSTLDGTVMHIEVGLNEVLQPNDVLFVEESFF